VVRLDIWHVLGILGSLFQATRAAEKLWPLTETLKIVMGGINVVIILSEIRGHICSVAKHVVSRNPQGHRVLR